MAYINVDEVYILNNTGLQVDMATDIPFVDAGFTDAQKEQARKNIAAGGSNDNLLNNAYFVGGGSQLGDGVFPINQRGQTQYTAAGFVFDRWFKSGGVTATLDASGLTIVNSNGWPDGVNQRFPMHFFAQMNGEAITASVLYADGSVDSGTAIIDATQNYQWLKYPEAGEIGFQLKNFQDGAAYDYFDYISFGAGAGSTPKKIKAFKLEKGTISTIKNDPVPDFGEELRHCQWYLFIRDYAQNDIIANGLTNNLTMFLPASMRSGGSPTMTFTTTPYVIGNSVISTPTSVNLVSVNGNQVQIYAPTTESHNAQTIVLYAGSATRMTISNEL